MWLSTGGRAPIGSHRVARTPDASGSRSDERVGMGTGPGELLLSCLRHPDASGVRATRLREPRSPLGSPGWWLPSDGPAPWVAGAEAQSHDDGGRPPGNRPRSAEFG